MLATVPTDFTLVRMQEKWKKFVVSGFPLLQWKKVIILMCFSVSDGRMFSLQCLFLQVGLWLGSLLQITIVAYD